MPLSLLARPEAPFPAAWRHVLMWGGLRGEVAIALALALPATLVQRDTVAAGVLGLVVWRLVGQGLFVGLTARWAGLRPTAPSGVPATGVDPGAAR